MSSPTDDTDPNEMLPLDVTDPGSPPATTPDHQAASVARVISGLGGATPWSPRPKQGASSNGQAFAAHAAPARAVPVAHRADGAMDPVLVDLTSPDELPPLHEHGLRANGRRGRQGSRADREKTTAPIVRRRRRGRLVTAAAALVGGVALLMVVVVNRPTVRAPSPAAATSPIVSSAAWATRPSVAVSAPPPPPPEVGAQATTPRATPPASATAVRVAPAAAPSATSPSRSAGKRLVPASTERDIDHEL